MTEIIMIYRWVGFITNNFPCADGETAGWLSQHLASYVASLALWLSMYFAQYSELRGGGMEFEDMEFPGVLKKQQAEFPWIKLKTTWKFAGGNQTVKKTCGIYFHGFKSKATAEEEKSSFRSCRQLFKVNKSKLF